MVLRRILTTAASGFDKTIGAKMLVRGDKGWSVGEADDLSHEDRLELLEEIRRIYDRPEHFQSPETFFPGLPGALGTNNAKIAGLAGPQDIEDIELSRVRSFGNGKDEGMVLDAKWQSRFVPLDEGVRGYYLGFEENKTATARLFVHAKARPAVILVHGYRCGQLALEERLWPLSWLFEQGLDVAIAVLPFHGVRAPKQRKEGGLFPSVDVALTIEGFRQSVADLSTLAALLRSRGSEAIGVMGMSLGGYTAGLWATLDPNLSFVAPIIPCTSIADVGRAMGLFSGTPEEQAGQHEALSKALWVTSPLAREPKIGPERVLVVGAKGDRITPVDHARRMAGHFGAPLETFHGGHLLQFGRADAFKAIGKMISKLGITNGAK